MRGFGQLLAFGAGSLYLGVALTFGVIYSIATRHSDSDSGEGCFVSLVCVMALGVAAFVAVGTLVVVITANTRIKDVLFPIIQLPLVIPLLIGAVEATQSAMQGALSGSWLQFLGIMTVVFLCLGFILYEFLLEE